MHVGQCLASLVSCYFNVSAIEKEEIDLLKYRLEHLERDNTELVKKLSFTKEAFQEVQESILHCDEQLRQAQRQIEALE